MLFSRLWYLVLSAAIFVVASALFVSHAVLNREYASHADEQLRRDRVDIELWLRADASARVYSLAAISNDGEIRRMLRVLSADRTRGESASSLSGKLEQQLRRVNQEGMGELQGDIVLLLNNEGNLVAQSSTRRFPPSSGFGAFPFVKRALAGYLRDDVWILDDEIYRIAARPVIDRGEYIGAVVHAKKFDPLFAKKIAERIAGATVAFFLGPRIVASFVPETGDAPRSEELAKPLGEKIAKQISNDPEDNIFMIRDGKGIAMASQLRGMAANQAGYIVARPRTTLLSTFDIFDQATKEDTAQARGATTRVGLLALGLFLLSLLFVWLERDRPLSRLQAAVIALSKDGTQKLQVSTFRGAYRKLSQSINEALEHISAQSGAAGPHRKPADLDQILGPTPASAPASSYFGFAGSAPTATDDIPDVPVAPPAAAVRKPPAMPANAPAPLPPTPVQPPPPAASAVTPVQPGNSPPIKPKTPLAPAVAKAPDTAARDTASRLSAAAAVAAAMRGNAGEGDEDAATTVAQVPPEFADFLPQKAQALSEEEYFKQVFEEFVATKKQCGEPTSGLTIEKFSDTLRKNTDQIVAKHGARKVRFAVYVKDGRAALRATPIKD